MVTARTLARGLRRLVVLVLVVVGARHVLGPLVSSVVLTALALWFGVRAWGRWENRWGAPRPARARVLVPDVVHRPPFSASSERHVAFARALAAVAAAYQAECEQEASQP